MLRSACSRVVLWHMCDSSPSIAITVKPGQSSSLHRNGEMSDSRLLYDIFSGVMFAGYAHGLQAKSGVEYVSQL